MYSLNIDEITVNASMECFPTREEVYLTLESGICKLLIPKPSHTFRPFPPTLTPVSHLGHVLSLSIRMWVIKRFL